MPRVRVLSFDVFGTLLDIQENKNNPDAYRHVARWFGYHGVGIDGDELRALLDLRIAEDLRNNWEAHPDVDLGVLLGNTIAELAPDSRELVCALVPEAALILRTLTTVSLSIVPGVKEVLRELSHTFQLGICSNTQRVYTIGELRMFGLLDFFEYIVFSSDVRASKPNAKIFRALLTWFDVAPDLVCHIGDRAQDDVEGARAVGMPTVLFERATRDHQSSTEGLKGETIMVAFENLPGIVQRL